MPLYKFGCPSNHVAERLVTMGTERIECACGAPAQRLSVFDPLVITERAKTPRDQQRINMRLFDEAAEEMDYHHRKAEEDAGKPLAGPNLWLMAKYRAGLIRAGLAPPPTGRR